MRMFPIVFTMLCLLSLPLEHNPPVILWPHIIYQFQHDHFPETFCFFFYCLSQQFKHFNLTQNRTLLYLGFCEMPYHQLRWLSYSSMLDEFSQSLHRCAFLEGSCSGRTWPQLKTQFQQVLQLEAVNYLYPCICTVMTSLKGHRTGICSGLPQDVMIRTQN